MLPDFLPRKYWRFDNYYNSSDAITLLKLNLKNEDYYSLIIEGTKGRGVSHLLNAIGNHYLDLYKKVIYISSQWLLKLVELNYQFNGVESVYQWIDNFDVIILDNMEFLYRRFSKVALELKEKIKNLFQSQKILIAGVTSNLDFTKQNKYKSPKPYSRIFFKEMSSRDVFMALKSHTTLEDHIPDKVLYTISHYNGPFQNHLNALISVRFKFETSKINWEEMSIGEIDLFLELKKYFPKQQLRKRIMNELFEVQAECGIKILKY